MREDFKLGHYQILGSGLIVCCCMMGATFEFTYQIGYSSS